jgi:hypothetical protein
MEAIDPGIIENIAAVAPLPSQPEIVDMRRRAVFEDSDQLMLAAVEAALARIGLVPDQQVLPFGIDRPARSQQLWQMSPVHEDEVDGPTLAMPNREANEFLEEGGELRFRELARSNFELRIRPRPMAWP